jgi:hypothetical protein
LALHVLEKGSLLRAVDLPEAEVVLVTGGHMSSPSAGAQRGRRLVEKKEHNSRAGTVTRVTR